VGLSGSAGMTGAAKFVCWARRPSMETPTPWYVYLLRCGDGSLYTGIAVDVASRLALHRAGRGARYTRGRGPLELCGTSRCVDHTEALRIEHAIKKLPRAEKLRLVRRGRLSAFVRAWRALRTDC